MKIIIGLGNPDKKYLKNRHNVGFMILDEFIKELKKENISVIEENKFEAVIVKVKYQNEDLLLVKPLTFMNNSGEAVSKILNFYKQPTENIIVIYDDIDLPLGTIRYREKGSAGTHNGMRSIIEHLGNQNFERIRIGIEARGETSPVQQDLSSFVLSDFSKEELKKLQTVIPEAINKLKSLV